MKKAELRGKVELILSPLQQYSGEYKAFNKAVEGIMRLFKEVEDGKS